MNDKVKDNNSPIAKRLSEARKRKGISQKALGIAAGIDEFSASPRMNQYEKGTHAPPLSILENIAKVLDVPLPYFYAEDDDTAQLLLNFHRMNDNEKDNILNITTQPH